MRRVYNFGSDEFAPSSELNKSISLLNSATQINEINDAIERYVINKYISNSNYEKFFNEGLNDRLDIKKRYNKELYSRYFNQMTNENFLELAKEVDRNYVSEFIEICVAYKIYLEVSSTIFLEILDYEQFYLSILLKHKELVKVLDTDLRELLIDNIGIVNVLIRHKIEGTEKQIEIPPSLSDADLNYMVENYIESNEANFNTLENIYRLKSKQITEETKFLAKKKYQEKMSELFKDKEAMMTCEITIKLSNELNSEDLFKLEVSDNKCIYSLNKEILEENLEIDEILGIITYSLYLVDKQFRIKGLSNKNKVSNIEKIFSNQVAEAYGIGIKFIKLNNLINLIVNHYIDFISANSIDIEQVIGYFFNSYLSEKFNIKNYIFNVPTKNINIKEKIKLLATELDSVVKQYHQIDKDKVINQEFVNFKSNVPEYRDIKSRVSIKNIYLNSEISKMSIQSLLNDQYPLYYYDIKEEITLESAILNNKAYFYELESYQQNILKDLIEEGFFTLEKEKIKFKSYHRYLLYKDLYNNDFISYHSQSEVFQEVINKDISKGHLFKDNKLLSEQEADLFDYYLTSKFIDSLEIRNKYIHGSTEANEEILNQDYIILIRLFLSLMVKIDDDLCIEDRLKSMESDDNSNKTYE